MTFQPPPPPQQQQQQQASKDSSSNPTPSYAPALRPAADTLSKFCPVQFSWLFNERGENPCVIARLLIDDVGACKDAEYYPLSSLVDKFPHYPPPNFRQASPCTCSMEIYNLVQACSTCQSNDLLPWSTSWIDWSTNCGHFSISHYPKFIENDILPIYGLVDNSKGSWEVGQAFKLVTGRNMTQPSNVAISTTISSIPIVLSTSFIVIPLSTSTTSITAALATSSLVPGAEYIHQGGPDQKIIIISVVLVLLFAAGIGAVVALYIQKKIRTRRQGVRLGSTLDLLVGGKGGGNSKAAEKFEAQDSVDSVSLFLPTESFLSSRPPNSRNSSTYTYTTNSSSSQQSHLFAPSISESDGSYASTDFSRTISDDDGSSFITATETDDDETSPFADHHSTSTISLSSSSSSSRTISSLGLITPPTAYLATRFHNRYSINTETSDTNSILSASTAGAVYGRDD